MSRRSVIRGTERFGTDLGSNTGGRADRGPFTFFIVAMVIFKRPFGSRKQLNDVFQHLVIEVGILSGAYMLKVSGSLVSGSFRWPTYTPVRLKMIDSTRYYSDTRLSLPYWICL